MKLHQKIGLIIFILVSAGLPTLPENQRFIALGILAFSSFAFIYEVPAKRPGPGVPPWGKVDINAAARARENLFGKYTRLRVGYTLRDMDIETLKTAAGVIQELEDIIKGRGMEQ